MPETTADFGTGLRAHLGLVEAEPTPLDAAFERVECALERAAVMPQPEPVHASLDALEALETELFDREQSLNEREAVLAGRAGTLLAAAQALYDEVLGGCPADHDDELARLRRRKSVA